MCLHARITAVPRPAPLPRGPRHGTAVLLAIQACVASIGMNFHDFRCSRFTLLSDHLLSSIHDVPRMTAPGGALPAGPARRGCHATSVTADVCVGPGGSEEIPSHMGTGYKSRRCPLVFSKVFMGSFREFGTRPVVTKAIDP